MSLFFVADKIRKKGTNGEGKSLKIMSVSEVVTFGIQKQLLNERTTSAEAGVLPFWKSSGPVTEFFDCSNKVFGNLAGPCQAPESVSID